MKNMPSVVVSVQVSSPFVVNVDPSFGHRKIGQRDIEGEIVRGHEKLSDAGSESIPAKTLNADIHFTVQHQTVTVVTILEDRG